MIEQELADLHLSVGRGLGPSRPIVVGQERIDRFAATTEDAQWIHTDPRQADLGPFGGTVAHGFLTLSLASAVVEDLLAVRGARLAVNYGLGRVRFPSQLPAGSYVVGAATVLAAAEVQACRQLTLRLVLQAEGAPKPACVADMVVLYLGPSCLDESATA